MPFGSDPLEELAVPHGTTVEEHDLVVDGDVVVGGQSNVEFGVRGRSLMAGERVRIGGDVEAEGDCRLDMWSTVDGNVLVGEDAYIGERVDVGGELKVAGNLDIGDEVDIEEGFEANGWIRIRNPMPTIVFLFVYLAQLLRIGEEEAANEMIGALVGDEEGGPQPLVVPRGALLSDDAWRVSTPATVGDDCRIHGNLRAESLEVGRVNVVFGSLRAKEDVVVGRGTEIKGDVTTRGGDVHLGPGAEIWGDVSARDVALHENATVEGTIRTQGELRTHTDPVIERVDEAAEAMAEVAEELADDVGSVEGSTGVADEGSADCDAQEPTDAPEAASEDAAADSEETPEREASAGSD